MKHKEIEFGFGNLGSAVVELTKYKERGELVCERGEEFSTYARK